MGVAAVAIQIDTLNGIIYSYLPSRRLDFSEIQVTDGMRLWNRLIKSDSLPNSLINPHVITSMSIVVSALLYLFYAVALVRLGLFAYKCKRENRLIKMRIDEEQHMDYKVSKTQLSKSFNPSATVLALYGNKR